MLKSYRSCRFCRIWIGTSWWGNVTYQIAQTRQSSNAPKIVVDLLDGWFNPLKLHTRCKQQKQLDECFSVPNVPTHLKLIANLEEKRLLHWDMNPVASLSFITFDSFIYIWFHSMWLFFFDQSFLCRSCIFGLSWRPAFYMVFPWRHGMCLDPEQVENETNKWIQMRADVLCSLLVWLYN